jgi:hypothetical protein
MRVIVSDIGKVTHPALPARGPRTLEMLTIQRNSARFLMIVTTKLRIQTMIRVLRNPRRVCPNRPKPYTRFRRSSNNRGHHCSRRSHQCYWGLLETECTHRKSVEHIVGLGSLDTQPIVASWTLQAQDIIACSIVKFISHTPLP